MKYTISWKWRDDEKKDPPRIYKCDATDAQRAINKLKASLKKDLGEGETLGTYFVPIEVTKG